jgi:flagellin-like protein
MSAKHKRIERAQRFRRLRRGEKRAVSPVVATLILILIAVAAAAALYLWLVAWQGGVTSGIGSPGAQSTLTIGGSTSVYPFTSLAISWFEQNNTDIAINNNGGGSGAGMAAVCSGQISIGATSTPETATTLESQYGCPAVGTETVTTIAYDAVDVVVQGANPHGLQSINHDTLLAIYDRASTTPATLVSTTFNGVAIPAGIPAGALEWQNIPAAVSGTTLAGVLQAEANGGTYAALGGAGQAAGTGVLANDIVTNAADSSPCGWTICAGPFAGATSANAIVPVERSDASGATLTLEAKLFGATSPTGFATSYAGLGYSGCGSNNILSDCGIAVATSENGDGGVLSQIASNPNAIGYASDGLSRLTPGVGVAGIIPFDGVQQQTF